MKIRAVMTPNPVALDASAPVMQAAEAMRENDIGDVVVRYDGKLCGIVTDRDIVGPRPGHPPPAGGRKQQASGNCFARRSRGCIGSAFDSRRHQRSFTKPLSAAFDAPRTESENRLRPAPACAIPWQLTCPTG